MARPAPNASQQACKSAASSLQQLGAASRAFEQFPARPLRGSPPPQARAGGACWGGPSRLRSVL
eukprot:8151790-Alexandrium_andersonii.AAC.1